MNAQRITSLVGAVVLALGLAAVSANAASINYGDFTGSSVMYIDVTESANTPGDTAPLYGAPSISADTLDFDPQGFVAAAEGCRTDITDGQLNLMLMGMGGDAITSITLSEGGDYSLVGSGGSATTQISYGLALASVVVLEIDGVALGAPIVLAGASASGGDDLGNGTDVATLWSLSLDYDVNAALAAAGVSFLTGATKIEIAIDNTLIAIAEDGAAAFVGKKDFMITASSVVPEPASLVLMGSALCGLGWMGRRRRGFPQA